MDETEPFSITASISRGGECYSDEFQGQELIDFHLIKQNKNSSIVMDEGPSSFLSNSSHSLSSSDSTTHSSSSFPEFTISPTIAPIILPSTKSNQKAMQHQQQKQCHRLPIHILGKSYKNAQNPAFELDQGSLFWFTYRKDFPQLMPYKITSDAGWGCMLRASQMLLAQALRVHFRGREWKPSSIRNEGQLTNPNTIPSMNQTTSPNNSPNRHFSTYNKTNHHSSSPYDEFTTFIANAFADYPGSHFPFSLPNMVATGLRYDKLPGEWYGPSTAAHVLRDLVLIYQQYQNEIQTKYKNHQNYNNGNNGKNGKNGNDDEIFQPQKDIFKIMVAQEGCVYKDEVEEFMTQEGLVSPTNNTNTKEHSTKSDDPIPLHPLEADISMSSSDKEPQTNNKNRSPNTPHIQWDTSLLLLIPLRLGLKRFNTDYSEALGNIFALPQCVGVLGGSPRHAIWFYGSVKNGYNDPKNIFNDSGSGSGSGSNKTKWKLYGLDPHTVQPTPPLQYNTEQKRPRKRIIMNQRNMSTLHPSGYFNPNNSHNMKPVCMDIKNIDPSLALAFYCKDRTDFEDLVEYMNLLQLMDNENDKHGKEIPFENKQKHVNLFSFMDTKPDYSAQMSLLVDDDAQGDSDDELNGGERKSNKNNMDCDEDEYIFL